VSDIISGTVTIEVSGQWAYTTREMLDWIEERLRQPIQDRDWGTGRGGINYAQGKVVSVVISASQERK
jgi:hypothetical protein